MLQVGEEVKEFLITEYQPNGQGTTIGDNDNLIEAEIIDSLGMFILIEFLEKHFGVSIEPEEVTADNFESISTIERLVLSKLQPEVGP